jgi:hypothetical protein
MPDLPVADPEDEDGYEAQLNDAADEILRRRPDLDYDRNRGLIYKLAAELLDKRKATDLPVAVAERWCENAIVHSPHEWLVGVCRVQCYGVPPVAVPDHAHIAEIERVADRAAREYGFAWIDQPWQGHLEDFIGDARASEFIQACDPPTILALLVGLRQAEAEIARAQQGEIHWGREAERLNAGLRQAEEHNERKRIALKQIASAPCQSVIDTPGFASTCGGCPPCIARAALAVEEEMPIERYPKQTPAATCGSDVWLDPDSHD